MNKQIEEIKQMACDMCTAIQNCNEPYNPMPSVCKAYKYAEKAHKKGYRKQTEGEWISVEDKLPEASGIYLVYSYLGNRMVLDYSAKHKLFNSFDSYSKKAAEALAIGVTHWMPLPEPPEMKGGE